MRLPDEPGFPALPPGQPTRDLLLAQALDACITAERRLPGSSQEIIRRQPAWARADLQRLVGLAGSLDAATSNAVMSSEFRVAARARLMRRIGAIEAPGPREPRGIVRLNTVSASPGDHVARGRALVWTTRATASLVAAVLAVAATLTASASALPGEPLYGLKEAREELALRLAADDQQRALALLQQANARLDETNRLLQQGRTLDATVTTLRYDQIVQRATMSYVGTIDNTPPSAPATMNMEASLSQDQDQLRTLLQFAPEPARADLREALVATERGRALVADPRPVDLGLGRSDQSESALAAAIPTMAAEADASPTAVPTVQAENTTLVPTRRPAVVLSTPTPAAIVADARMGDGGADTTPVMAQVGGFAGGDGGDAHGDSRAENRAGPATTANQTHWSNQHAETALVSPTVVAHDDSQASGFDVNAQDGGDDHPQAVEQAVAINARSSTDQGGGAPRNQNQADRSSRAQDVSAPVVTRQAQEPAVVRATPTVTERTAAASPSPSDHNTHDNGGDAHLSPTAQATPTKPPSTSASTGSHETSGATVHHSADGDQKSSASNVPAPHNGGGDHSGNDSGH